MIMKLALIVTVIIGFGAQAYASAPIFEGCIQSSETENVTLVGIVVETVDVEGNEGLGRDAGTKIVALTLDTPICTASGNETFIEVVNVSTRWMGHHVMVTGTVTSDETFSIFSDRIVDFNRNSTH